MKRLIVDILFVLMMVLVCTVAHSQATLTLLTPCDPAVTCYNLMLPSNLTVTLPGQQAAGFSSVLMTIARDYSGGTRIDIEPSVAGVSQADFCDPSCSSTIHANTLVVKVPGQTSVVYSNATVNLFAKGTTVNATVQGTVVPPPFTGKPLQRSPQQWTSPTPNK